MIEKDDWRLNGQEEYLSNALLYKIKFPDFWEKAYAEKNEFYDLVKKDALQFVNTMHRGEEWSDGENIQHFWHEHCEFCWEKALTDKAGEFYCTQDFKHWICLECFNDFKDMFHWNIADKA